MEDPKTTETDDPHSEQAYEERRVRAVERLKNEPANAWFYPILGLRMEEDVVELWNGIKIQSIEEPPNAFELGAALQDRTLFLNIGRYTHLMQWELVIPWEQDEPRHVPGSWARIIVDAIRVRTQASLLVPAGCNHSWSSLNAFKDQSCVAWMIEDSPTAKLIGERITVTVADIQWVADYIGEFADRLGHSNFDMAVKALSSHFRHHDHRVMVAILWAAIESLFSISQELSHRLSAYIALALEPRGQSCRDLYVRVKKLYNVRSKAVHGGAVSVSDLESHIIEVRALLSKLLCRFTEAAWLPDEHDFEDLLLMEPSKSIWPGELGPLSGLANVKEGEISRRGNPHRRVT